jgi:hypothetical protein
MPGHLELITYEYSLGTGWEQVTHKRPTLPLDKIKHLGILRDSTVERDLIRNLDKEIAIRYENIATILQYIPVDELNTMISEIHSSTSDIIGEFPKLVCITEKKGIKDHEKSQGDIQVSGSVARKRTSKSI